jgi:hypothetical protein
MRHAKADAIVLHPGPLNRGIEITPEVADSAQSCVLEQVTNGIAVRMALLFLLTAGGDPGAMPSPGSLESPTPASQEPRNRRATDTKTDIKDAKDPSHASR